jgi:hypothetical protein
VINQSILEDFYTYFSGNNRAYGEFTVTEKTNQGEKVPGKARTITKTLKKENYEAHLSGEAGLGIVPINYNNQCRFGVIDIDDYNLDLRELNKKINLLELPLILFRSKSGGAHLYLFLRSFVNAEEVIEILKSFSALLGYSETEIFPKQKVLKKGAVGNWINLPYFNLDKTDRYAYSRDFKILDLYEAIKRIKEESKDISELNGFIESLPFQDGPPCLQRLFLRGVGRGGRNEFLFNVAIYLKQKHPDDWEEKLANVNQRLKTPITYEELTKSVINSLKKKEYFYRCENEPLKSVCSKSLCRQKEYGIENASIPSEVIGALTKIIFHAREVSWELEVNNGILQFENTADLMKHSTYQEKCMEQLNIWPRTVKQEAWRKIIEERLKEVNEVEGSEELSQFGQFKILLNRFLETANVAVTREQMLIKGKIYFDKKGTKCSFRSEDLSKFIIDNKVYTITHKKMWTFLRELNAVNKQFGININNNQKEVRTKIKIWELNDIKPSALSFIDMNMQEIREKEHQDEKF